MTSTPGPLDPAAWARVHDRREPPHLSFWRGLDLCADLCGERVEPGALWLDVGAGTGHLTNTLAARGARALALDHDSAMALYAHRRWNPPPRVLAQGATEGRGAQDDRSATSGARAAPCFAISCAVATAGSLPLADGSCAGVVAVSLLGYLAAPATFFAEAARVLAPGGTLCFTAMNRHSLLLAASKALAWPRRQRRPRGNDPSPTGRFVAHDPAALAGALRRAGLEPERQLLYAHFVGDGRRIVPPPSAVRRRERWVPPGTRSAWARQILLIARRSPIIPSPRQSTVLVQ